MVRDSSQIRLLLQLLMVLSGFIRRPQIFFSFFLLLNACPSPRMWSGRIYTTSYHYHRIYAFPICSNCICHAMWRPQYNRWNYGNWSRLNTNTLAIWMANIKLCPYIWFPTKSSAKEKLRILNFISWNYVPVKCGHVKCAVHNFFPIFGFFFCLISIHQIK